MALTPKQRDQRRREKQERLGEQDLRLKVTTTHASQLAELMSWDEIEESGEALTLLIYRNFIIRLLIERAHALGPIQALTLLSLPPRHKYAVSNSVARALDQWRMQREFRAPDIRLGADPDDKCLLLLANV